MSTALDELFASNPRGQIHHLTLEFRHPAFLNAEGVPAPIRVVQGFNGIVATLEAGAPEDDSTAVTFNPAAFRTELPRDGTTGSHTLEVTFDAGAEEIITQLERVAAANRAPIKIRVREFISSDLSAPQGIPIELTVLNPRVKDSAASFECVFADVQNKQYPSIFYTVADFPSLA